MFTGLVQALGKVAKLRPDAGGGCRLEIDAEFGSPKDGESIAVNGACLTVIGKTLAFDIGPETLAKTNLGRLKPGDRVNLERALKVGDPLGGHIVSGHVDGVGTFEKRETSGGW